MAPVRGYWNTTVSAIRHIAFYDVMDYSWMGLGFQIPIAIACIDAFWVYLPPPGVATTLMGFAAVVVAIRAEAKKSYKWSLGEKVVWVLLAFALLITELRSIYDDRSKYEQRQNTADAAHLQEVADLRFRLESIRQNIVAEYRTAQKAQNAARQPLGVLGLKQRALTLASEINGFLANTQIAAGYGQGGFGEGRFGGGTVPQPETVAAFQKAFGPRVRNIRDALEKRGLTDMELDREYRNTVNAFSIKQIADGIERLADKLPE